MTSYHKDIKYRLSMLIEFERNKRFQKTGDKKWLRSNFIRYDDGSFICSDKTYRKITRGNGIHDEVIIGVLLEKLNESYIDIEPVERMHINELLVLLLKAVEWGDTSSTIAYSFQSLHALEKYDHYFYYREYSEVIKLIQKFYIDSQLMEESQYQKLRAIVAIFVPSVQIMVKELLYRYCHYTYADTAALNELSKQLNLQDETNVMLQLNQAYQDIFNGNILDAYDTCAKLIPILKSDNNYSLLLTVYSTIISICGIFNKNLKEGYLNNLEELLNDHSDVITPNKQGNCFFMLAMQAFARRDFSKAYLFYRKAIELDDSLYQNVCIYMRFIEHQIDVVPIKLPVVDISTCTELFQVMYRYFVIKEEVDIKGVTNGFSRPEKKKLMDLIDYIMDQIMPNLSQYDVPYIGLFQSELDTISTYIGDYSEALRFRIYFSKHE